MPIPSRLFMISLIHYFSHFKKHKCAIIFFSSRHIVLESTITEIVFICKGNWIIKCHTRRPKFDWPSSKNNCKSSPDEFCPESDSALTHNLHFVKTRRPHFLVVPKEMWLEKMREQLMETLTSRWR